MANELGALHPSIGLSHPSAAVPRRGAGEVALRIGISTLVVAAAGAVLFAVVRLIDPDLLTRLSHLGPRQILGLALGKSVFWVALAHVLVIPAALSGHYRVVGPKSFSHEGAQVRVFSLMTRLVHWTAAVSCLSLIGTGLVMMGAATPGIREAAGEAPFVRVAWQVHACSAVAFVGTILFMLAQWAGKMLPRFHDLKWLLIGGGYLSRAKKPVPAHMFNAGQKMWFWLATLGGLAMACTGLAIHYFWGGSRVLNVMALVHHALAVAIVTMTLVHIYMAVFAIRGSLGSMVNGRKSEEELAILHSLYYRELREESPALFAPVPCEAPRSALFERAAASPRRNTGARTLLPAAWLDDEREADLTDEPTLIYRVQRPFVS